VNGKGAVIGGKTEGVRNLSYEIVNTSEKAWYPLVGAGSGALIE